ncbi:hypothetical protein GCM10010353_68600 [Streptomyces chryseus]|nr:hypothetical protein GCM10010353_68600 [Streptomyces chryseus]
MRGFSFSGVAGHSLSSSFGLLAITGDHVVMLEDLTLTAFWEVGLGIQATCTYGPCRRRVHSGPLPLPRIAPSGVDRLLMGTIKAPERNPRSLRTRIADAS